MEEMLLQLESGRVPVLSIAFMFISMTLMFVIFLIVPIILVKYKHCKLTAYVFGCLTWLLFASFLEGLIHSIVLRGQTGAVLTGNIWLYALYGAFMAALFEEGGRFLTMKFVMKKEIGNNANAIAFGAGHGGFEAISILCMGMLSNLVLSIVINTGAASSLTASLNLIPEEQAMSALSSMLQLVTLPPYMFLVGIFERIAAIAAHIGMSVFVWFAVKEKKTFLWGCAFLMHFFLDFVTVIVNANAPNVIITEIAVYLIAAAYVFLAVKLYKAHNIVEEVSITTEE